MRFNDGGPFTAGDMIASVRRIPSTPGNPGPYTSNLRTITGVTAVDHYTVRVTTDRPNPLLPGQFPNVFVLSKAFAGASPEDFSSARATVGTGPFRLVSFRYGDTAVLEPNPYYRGAPSPWRRVVIRVIGNDAAREAALLAGDLDLIENVPPEDVERLRAIPGMSVYSRSADRVAFLLPNVARDTLPLLTDQGGAMLARNPLRDPRVRQAVSLALDRNALVPACCPARARRRCSLCRRISAVGTRRCRCRRPIRRVRNDCSPMQATPTASA